MTDLHLDSAGICIIRGRSKFIDAEGIFDTYWANTSNNKLVSSLIRKSSKNMKMAMEQLLEGEMLHVEMDEQLDFAQLSIGESAIFSLLYATGIYA